MPNGIQVDFKYDLFGHRVEKVVSTTTVTTTRYVYSGEAIIGILDGNNNVVSRVIHGPGVDEPLMIRTGTNEAYLYADGLGSIIAVADANATLQETVEYQAYGKAVYKDAVSGSTATVSYTGNPYGYTGREPDAETGLYYYRARYYDPEAGRFIQPDPAGFAGGDTNLYAYVGNNPTNYADPSGLRPLTNAERAEVDDAVREAQYMAKLLQNSFAAKLAWFASVVKTGGKYDLKSRTDPATGIKYKRGTLGYVYREALGNYNYGAMFAALFNTTNSSDLEWAMRAAGVYSCFSRKKTPPEWGSPFGGPPYGDDPDFSQNIKDGFSGVDDLALPLGPILEAIERMRPKIKFK